MASTLLSVQLTLFGLSAVWLAFMILCPAKWSSWVEAENRFWVRKGFLQAATAEKIASFEKGIWLKLLVAAGMVTALAGIWLILQ